MTDQGNDSDIPPEDETGVYDFSEIRAQVATDRQVRNRHLLVRMNGSFVGQVHALGPDRCEVGRLHDSDVWLNDPGVSREHARIEADGDGFAVVDLDSANGTFVYGKRISRHRLTDGDIIQFGATALFRFAIADADHQRMLVALYEASVRDSLTGTYNREHLNERLSAETAFARRHSSGLSLVMFDLDHFKRINDTYGHQTGDRVLVQVTKAVGSAIRLEDLLARYGGEEFVVVLRNIPLEGAAALAERLRAAVEGLSIHTDQGPTKITASFGCAALTCCSEISGLELIGAADRRLLIAKRAGRNRVVAEG